MLQLQPLLDEYESRGLVIITVAADSDEHIKEFWEENGLEMAVLSDTDYSISSSFDVRGYPTGYFIDREGLIVDKSVGWGGSSLKKWIEKAEKLLPE